MEPTNKVLDFAKRHSTWLIIALITFIFAMTIFEKQAETQAQIDNLIMSIDAGDSGDESYRAIDKLDSKNRSSAPLLILFYVIAGVVIAIPLASIVLYSYTNVPFTKFMFYGKNNNIDSPEREGFIDSPEREGFIDSPEREGFIDSPEREGFFKVASAVWIGVCLIIACGIIILGNKI